MKYQVLFSLKKKNEKVFMNVICCSLVNHCISKCQTKIAKLVITNSVVLEEMAHLDLHCVPSSFSNFKHDIAWTKHFSNFCRRKFCCLPFELLHHRQKLNPTAPNKNCSRQHFNLYLYLLKKIRLDFSSESSA